MNLTRGAANRQVTSVICMVVYLWSALFVAFDHNHEIEPGLAAARLRASHRASHQKLRQGFPRPEEVCLACMWDQAAGNNLVSSLTTWQPPRRELPVWIPSRPAPVEPRPVHRTARAPPSA
ncbi:MAG TPA: hypothetical protein VFJ58_07650 [Armatimonadota bacterium]|nr:hypothetical protein [Armatimonadota bacterium]